MSVWPHAYSSVGAFSRVLKEIESNEVISWKLKQYEKARVLGYCESIQITTFVLISLIERYESSEYADRYDDVYPTKPSKEEGGGDPAEGGEGGKGGEDKGEKGGEDNGGDAGGDAGGNGGEKPTEPPVGDDGDIDAKKHKGCKCIK